MQVAPFSALDIVVEEVREAVLLAEEAGMAAEEVVPLLEEEDFIVVLVLVVSLALIAVLEASDTSELDSVAFASTSAAVMRAVEIDAGITHWSAPTDEHNESARLVADLTASP